MNKLSKINFSFLSFLLLFILAIVSCTNDAPNEPETYDIPSTYNFENVSYNGQTQRLAMLQEMKNYMETANTTGTSISADKLKAMFENDVVNAGFIQTYDDSKQLKSKTFENQQVIFESLFEDFEAASQSTIVGVNGTAGVVVSLDGLKAYLMNDKGLEYTQIIEKGLMGACFYYQSTAVYFGDDKMNVDNETVEPNEGTAMEHHWDEAFGYFGVPIDFPTNTDGLAFWGKYCNDRNAIIETNAGVMDHFLKGRAAISNNDLDARNAAIIEIQKNWELVSVGTAIHYINTALTNFSDDALRNHALSEVAAFTYALQFNPNKKVTNANVNDLLTQIGGDSAFENMNFYTVTEADLNAAKDQLAIYYSLENVKDSL
jgi:hypothetical protein